MYINCDLNDNNLIFAKITNCICNPIEQAIVSIIEGQKIQIISSYDLCSTFEINLSNYDMIKKLLIAIHKVIIKKINKDENINSLKELLEPIVLLEKLENNI